MKLTTAQLDRACGVMVGTAAGDALGAPYEFQPPRGADLPVAMAGGSSFGWEPGEWTDDTSMAIAVAEVAATGVDLRSGDAQDRIVARWCEWARDAPDVGNQTRSVLGSVSRAADGIGARSATRASRALHDRTGHTAGNGSLMRTGPVALAYLDDEDGLVEAASAISALTHFDPHAGEACVLWCCAIRHAVLTGVIDIRVGLGRLDQSRRAVWSDRLDTASRRRPADFVHNGWVVEALQAAWSAIAGTPVPSANPAEHLFRSQHLSLALDAAVRGGRDTDTVAAIAGGLLGAAYGVSAVPAQWRRVLHGWPGLRVRDLVAMATTIATGNPEHARHDYWSWPGTGALARHPYDDGVVLAGVDALHALPAGVDAVVSLCRIGKGGIPGGVEQIDVRLIDNDGVDENVNLDFVLDDTVTLIEQLRAEGRTVLVHCVQAQSRTPTVAALYGMRKRGVAADVALADVVSVLPSARPIAAFRAALMAADPSGR